MWAGDPGRHANGRGRRETELARYFKLEYGGAEVDRLLAKPGVANHPSPGRFWKRLRRFATRRRGYGRRSPTVVGSALNPRPPAGASASPSSSEIGSGEGTAPQNLPAECRHAEWETLGSGGNATYLQCLACGALVVNQGGRLWGFSLDRPEAI